MARSNPAWGSVATRSRGLYNPKLRTGGQPHTETRAVAAAGVTPFYPGQMVRVLASGFVTPAPAGGAADDDFLGVCMSHLPAPATAASDQVDEIQVVTDMDNTIWEIQMSATAANASQAILGANVSTLNMSTVNTTKGHSLMYVGISSNVNHPWRIVGWPDDPTNDKDAANPRILVRLNRGTGAATTYHHYNHVTGI